MDKCYIRIKSKNKHCEVFIGYDYPYYSFERINGTFVLNEYTFLYWIRYAKEYLNTDTIDEFKIIWLNHCNLITREQTYNFQNKDYLKFLPE